MNINMTDFMKVGIKVCWNHPESSACGMPHSHITLTAENTSCSYGDALGHAAAPVEHKKFVT
jgi:hypothetical protein